MLRASSDCLTTCGAGWLSSTFVTHFIDLRVLLFEAFIDCRQRIFEFLHFLVLFKKLVEQHRVHPFVAHGVNVPSASSTISGD